MIVPLLIVAADPMRPIDIIGLFGFMVLGLAGMVYSKRVVQGLAVFMGGSEPANPLRRAVEIGAWLLVLTVLTVTVVGSGLTALGVLAPRPEPYPGGLVVDLLAVGVLCAFACIVGGQALKFIRRW